MFIDAKQYGNYGRFTNYSKENPNVVFERWIKGDGYIIAAVAKCDIKASSELFADYWHKKSMYIESWNKIAEEMLTDPKTGFRFNSSESNTVLLYTYPIYTYHPIHNTVSPDQHHQL